MPIASTTTSQGERRLRYDAIGRLAKINNDAIATPKRQARRRRDTYTAAFAPAVWLRATNFAQTSWNDSVMAEMSISSVYTAATSPNAIGPSSRAIPTL